MIKIIWLIYTLAGLDGFSQSYDFKVRYGVIYAGSAELSYTLVDGILKSSLTIASSPWLSNLWTLTDSISSTYHLETGRLKTHYKAIHEGSYHRNYMVEFGDSNQVQINDSEKVVEETNFKDLPSLLYDLSQYQFRDGDTLQFSLWDGRSYGMLMLVVEKVGKPKLFTPFALSGWKLTPLSSTDKSRENRIQLALHLSNTRPHIPLRIEIDTKYGGVLMRLEDP
ncbi:MAG: DUF3108 domain-containing protein [Candidatus Marinimicrobia bacterium]|nr:DUF3108 domain-containing protein [Candidatus Neomarinimicrobiota bacterium]